MAPPFATNLKSQLFSEPLGANPLLVTLVLNSSLQPNICTFDNGGDLRRAYIGPGSPEESPEELDSCKFEELPEGAQTELEKAIEEADFEAENRVLYRLEDRPELLDTDCSGQYIEFEGDYYEVNVITGGG